MHVLPVKHSFGKCDKVWQTDGQTDGQSDPYVSLCFAGDTKTTISKYKDHGQKVIDLGVIWKAFIWSSIHIKFEVSISYGSKVMAKDKVFDVTDRQDKNKMSLKHILFHNKKYTLYNASC